jgi:hypothetical protein
VRKKKTAKMSLGDISPRLRGFVLDSQIQNAHEISVLLGCSAISDEIAVKEENESDKRVEKISYLIPLLYAYSRTLSEGTAEYQKMNLPEELEDLPSEIWLESRKMMEQFALSILIGAVSQMIDMNLLQIPKGHK